MIPHVALAAPMGARAVLPTDLRISYKPLTRVVFWLAKNFLSFFGWRSGGKGIRTPWSGRPCSALSTVDFYEGK
jgi:hypothetical protein